MIASPGGGAGPVPGGVVGVTSSTNGSTEIDTIAGRSSRALPPRRAALVVRRIRVVV
jgi:hypothetical protein